MTDTTLIPTPRKETDMKRITLITLAMSLAIALFQPIPTFAEGKAQKEKGQGKGGGKAAAREQISKQPRISAPLGASSRSAAHRDSANTKSNSIAAGRARGSQ